MFTNLKATPPIGKFPRSNGGILSLTFSDWGAGTFMGGKDCPYKLFSQPINRANTKQPTNDQAIGPVFLLQVKPGNGKIIIEIKKRYARYRTWKDGQNKIDNFSGWKK